MESKRVLDLNSVMLSSGAVVLVMFVASAPKSSEAVTRRKIAAAIN